MARINVFELCGHGERKLAGWFEDEKAEHFSEARRFDGRNYISIATGTQTEHEALYRTAGGRWVLHSWSQWQGSPELYRFIDEDEAREWLLLNEHDEAVEKYFGEVEEERGPGRPEIGPTVLIRLPESLIAALDERAEADGVSRAEVVRQLLGKSLAEEES